MITRILLTSYPWLVSFSVTDESDTFWAALRFAFHPTPSRQMAVNSQAFPNDLIGSSGSTVGAVCTLQCCYLKHPRPACVQGETAASDPERYSSFSKASFRPLVCPRGSRELRKENKMSTRETLSQRGGPGGGWGGHRGLEVGSCP